MNFKQIRKTENVPELAIVKLTSSSLCAACAAANAWWYVPKVQVAGWLIDLLFSTRVIFIIGKRSRIWNSDIIDDLFCFVFVFAVCIIAENHNLWCFLACLAATSTKWWIIWRQPQRPRIKGSYLDKILLQHDSLYPIGLKSARIEILHSGFHYIDL